MANDRDDNVTAFLRAPVFSLWHGSCTPQTERPSEGVVAMELVDVILPLVLLGVAYLLLFTTV